MPYLTSQLPVGGAGQKIRSTVRMFLPGSRLRMRILQHSSEIETCVTEMDHLAKVIMSYEMCHVFSMSHCHDAAY
jgi:hypothetical protein